MRYSRQANQPFAASRAHRGAALDRAAPELARRRAAHALAVFWQK